MEGAKALAGVRPVDAATTLLSRASRAKNLRIEDEAFLVNSSTESFSAHYMECTTISTACECLFTLHMGYLLGVPRLSASRSCCNGRLCHTTRASSVSGLWS
jgi:hypothetical protein